MLTVISAAAIPRRMAIAAELRGGPHITGM